MYIAGDGVPTESVLRARVCIVGAGPAGLTLADDLARAGIDVLVIEAGSRTPPAGGSPYDSTTNVGTSYPLNETRVRGVGGSANHWDFIDVLGVPSLRLHELDELDFAARPGVRDLGWPFGLSELQAGYRQARELFGVPPSAYEGQPGGQDAVERRSYAYGLASTFTRDVPERLDDRPNVRVVTDAVVTDVRTDVARETVSCLRCCATSGTRFSVEATVYVLAGGGLENARLLLASRSTAPEGLGNTSDHVGRWFNEHPHHGSAVVVPRAGHLERDLPAWTFYRVGERVAHTMYALSQSCLETEGLLNSAFFLTLRPPSRPVALTSDGHVDDAAMVSLRSLRDTLETRRWGPGTARHVGRLLTVAPHLVRGAVQQSSAQRAVAAGRSPRSPRILTLNSMNEQQPQRDSRLRLTPRFDRFGVPEAELDWRVSPLDLVSMQRTVSQAAPGLARLLGASVHSLLGVEQLPAVTHGYHHMGTTRMTSSARDGVVDPDSRVHGVRNLFVTGSSVFPSSGAANPTLTIVTLALRLGALLRSELAEPLGRAGASAGLASPGPERQL